MCVTTSCLVWARWPSTVFFSFFYSYILIVLLFTGTYAQWYSWHLFTELTTTTTTTTTSTTTTTTAGPPATNNSLHYAGSQADGQVLWKTEGSLLAGSSSPASSWQRECLWSSCLWQCFNLAARVLVVLRRRPYVQWKLVWREIYLKHLKEI